jgi:hypothetical protein
LCIDTADPARIASFWEAAPGWRRTWEEEDQVCLEPPEGSLEDGIAPDLVFLKVPEGKTVKNRLHLDLRPADQPAEVARLDRCPHAQHCGNPAAGSRPGKPPASGPGSRVEDLGGGAHVTLMWTILAPPELDLAAAQIGSARVLPSLLITYCGAVADAPNVATTSM